MQTTEFFTPKTMQEACTLLADYGKKAKVIAGGTDLAVNMKHDEVPPAYIVNIREIPGYDNITFDTSKGLKIGALTKINSLENSPLIQEKFSILAEAASKLGVWQVRNRATIGGNICNAATSADTVPPLMALGALLKLMSKKGERTVPIEEFFTGPGKTVLKPEEVLVEIQIPGLAPHSGGAYLKQTIRKALDLAIIGVAAVVSLDGNKIKDVKIALGTAAPTPIRAKKAEDYLRGKKLDDEVLKKAGEIALGEASPRDSLRSSAKFRKEIIKVFVGRAVNQATERAQKAK